MLLTYIDESGINYKKGQNNLFVDGPYHVWVALLIDETKYFHMERLLCEMLKTIGVKNWQELEAHATDIWSRKGGFTNLSEKKALTYFEELFQLLKKLDIKVVTAVVPKNAKSHTYKNIISAESRNCQHALLQGIEHELGSVSETGVIIQDNTGNNVMDELLFEKTQWRYNPGARKSRKHTKYLYESYSCFILDRVHSMDSKSSLFLQLADHVVYVIRKVLEYVYIRDHTNIKQRKDLVPITSDTFKFTLQRSTLYTYSPESNDIVFIPFEDLFGGDDYLKPGALKEPLY